MSVRFWLLGVLMALPATARDDDRHHRAAFWSETYGVLEARDEPLVERAHKVFERVRAVADNRDGRSLRLLVLRDKPGLAALPLRDGTVLLTRAGLTLCYTGASRELGDGRLAFVVGHELAHLARDDFWHQFAFDSLADAAVGSSGTRERLRDDLRESAEEARRKELQADDWGLSWALQAGYPAEGVLARPSSFLDAWAAGVTRDALAGDARHPGPDERASLLRASLAKVASDVELFRKGTELLERGRWPKSIAALEAFRDRFPGREVLNNLGLAHLGIGRSALGACAAGEPLRFKLPALIESKTLADQPRSRGGDRERCRASAAVQGPLAEAEQYLRRAGEKDPSYAPARLNLGSVLILKGDFSAALAEAATLKREHPESADAVNLEAVAHYLYGLETQFDGSGRALALLDGVAAQQPRHAPTFYNRAAILRERGRVAEARRACEAFRALERSGPWVAACGVAGK